MNKSPETNSKNDPRDDLRQQLWELSYGLLEDDAAAALRTQIKSDPAIARLYSEVRLQTELVGRAARVEDSALQISAGPDAKVGKSGSRSSSTKIPAGKIWQPEKQSFGTNWLAIGGTVALLALLTFGLYQPQTVKTSVAQAEYFVTQITAPANTPEGVTQTVEINTTDVHNIGRSAELEVRVVDQEGRETFRETLKTDADGKAAVELPGNVVKPGVRLEAIPQEDSLRDRPAAVVTAPLRVTEEKKRKLLVLEKPSAQPGETVGFSMLEIGEYSKQLAAPAADELMIENRAGKAISQPTWETDRSAGVIRGQFAMPSDPAIESEQLAIRRRSLPEPSSKSADGRDAASKSDMLTERQELPLDRAAPRGGSRSQANGAQAGGAAFGGGNAQADADGNRLQRATKAMEARTNPLNKATADAKSENVVGEGGGAGGDLAPAGVPALARGGLQNAPGAAAAPAPPAPAPPMPPPGSPGKPETALTPPAAPAPPAPVLPAEAPNAEPDRKNMEKAIADAPAPKSGDQTNGVQTPPEPRPKAGLLKSQGGYGAAPANLGQAKDNGKQPGDESLERAANSQPRADQVEGAADKLPAAAAMRAALPNVPTAARGLRELADLEHLQLPADLQDQVLVLVARRGDTVIARREIVTGKDLQELDLPPEVDGRVEVELYRKGAEAEPVYRQELVRTAVRSLRFDVAGLKDSYAPGEKVKLQVRVMDENGHPAAAAVGVRVWNDVAAANTHAPLLLVDALAREEQISATNQLRALAMASSPRDAQSREAGKQAAFAAAAPASAAVNGPAGVGATLAPEQLAPEQLAPEQLAPEQLAPEQPQMKRADLDKALEPKVDEPATPNALTFDAADAQPANSPALDTAQVVADNRDLVQQEYDAAVAARQAEELARLDRVQTIGRILVWAGAGLMLLIGVLLIARSQLKTIVWVPAVGIAAASLALGLAWFVPPQPVGWQLARNENFGSVPAPETEVPPAVEPPTIAIAPAPADMPAVPAGPQPASEALKEVAPLAMSPPAKPGESASGGVTDEKSKQQQRDMVRAQSLNDIQTSDDTNDRAAADKPAAKKSAENERIERRGFAVEVPDSLFWRPLSKVGDDGLFTIEFTMPAAESEYRLLLDAVGNGRIGGQERLLLCREQ